jgi:hypothetical protein
MVWPRMNSSSCATAKRGFLGKPLFARNLAVEARWNETGHSGDQALIRNDRELAVTRERVAKLETLLGTVRKSARPEEWPALSSSYRLRIERMQGEILDYMVEGSPRLPEDTTAQRVS